MNDEKEERVVLWSLGFVFLLAMILLGLTWNVSGQELYVDEGGYAYIPSRASTGSLTLTLEPGQEATVACEECPQLECPVILCEECEEGNECEEEGNLYQVITAYPTGSGSTSQWLIVAGESPQIERGWMRCEQVEP